MSNVYLNGQFVAKEEAKISPMDRGFLFGDGIYEVIPSYNGKTVGLGLHLERMQNGLDAIGIKYDTNELKAVCLELIKANPGPSVGLYLHVSRGTDVKRYHAFPTDVAPTVFAYSFEIAPEQKPEKATVKPLKVATDSDLRWSRCHIKSTSLLGNVLHFQKGYDHGLDETLLFNEHDQLTEASASNAYIVKDGVVITPPLDDQLLPGVTRRLLLDVLAADGSIKVEERIVTREEVLSADEVWITSSSKEIAPVVEIDGQPVGDGQIGDVWLAAQTLYTQNKFDADQ